MTNIISVSGKAGSGKDLVGEIIQYLTSDYSKYSTDDYITFEECQRKIYEGYMSDWEVQKFATRPANCYQVITGVSYHKLSREEKELHRPKFIEMSNTLKQVFGTDVWVKALFEDYEEDSNWIITDLRYPQELQAITERKGITIRIARPCTECGLYESHKMSCSYNKLEDESETALDDYQSWDYRILNDGTVDDLIEKVRDILIEENIIPC